MDESTSSTESMKAAQPEPRIGSYRVMNPLGTGGMSSVFRAVHIETNQEVALKVLTRALAKNPTLLQRFLREARSAETLEHPNIVAIYDRGIDSGRHYLVLEYVAGGDLHDYIQRQGPLSLVEANSIIKSVAAGLDYAANRGLIHRDVKPSNILRTQAGEIKIIDLGLALQNEFEDERVTRDGTTVGTVDYMAPEQARDSRGTSIQSDMYSLGCTYYYLLAGVAPFPGGDITDKLTRHAKTPPPDVRDLRPDLPPELGAILLKLMAKRPEDRFASYAELITAIDAVPLAGGSEPPGVTFAPVDDSVNAVPASSGFGFGYGVTAVHPNGGSPSNGSADASIPLVSLAELAAEDDRGAAVREHDRARFSAHERPSFQHHAFHSSGGDGSRTSALEAPLPAKATAGSFPVTAWILPGAILFLAFMILGIGVSQFMGPHESGGDLAPGENGVVAGATLDRHAADSVRNASAEGRRASAVERRRVMPVNVQSTAVTRPKWEEPPDDDPPALPAREPELPAAAAAKYLPDWARPPIPERLDGPFVVVRRIADANDASSATSLHRALADHIGGTVELADEGPLGVDDLRVAGATRLIRARKGIRPIVRIDRSTADAVRKQSALVVLDRKSLILDGIDLIVDARELSRTQTAVFLCTAANLTLRNCSITILNYAANMPLSLIRVEASAPNASHIRLEGCLVRGAFTDGFRIDGGPCEVVVRGSVLAAGGGPLVRVNGADAALEGRIFLVQSLVAGPGPVIESTGRAAGSSRRPLVIRAFGSAFGRLHGSGIASVISSGDTNQPPAKQIDWSGDENLFAGWKGFFACGDDRTVTVNDLGEARSTWNGTDRSSREILAPWAHAGVLAGATPADFSSFARSHLAVLHCAARPRAGLYEKAVASYSEPAVPEPAAWTFRGTEATAGSVPANQGLLPAHMTDVQRFGLGKPPAAGSDSAFELTFKTDTAPWRGDLGAFLRDRLPPAFRFVRVRVVGSGRHRFTPLKLPSGIRLEIRVETTSPGDPPSWLPAEGATGTALIELERGALVLSNMILRPEPTAKLEHVIHVDDGHLMLVNCQLIAPASPEVAGDLIAFRSTSTEPLPLYLDEPLFSFATDRPVCRLIDCVLITGGRALRAELGRGLVALSQCAVAAGGTAIELKPANVARRRFECDLVLDRCTMTSDRTIVRVDPWPGQAPGPDRPWLITSRHSAFLSPNGSASKETLLLRAEGDALANGTVCWQADDDDAAVDWFISVGEAPPPANRSRDVQLQWVQFWGHNHMGRVTGPRGTGGQPSVRFRERLHAGQEIGPGDLTLDPAWHPDRPALSVGADLSRAGKVPMAAAPAPAPVGQRSTVPF